MRQLNTLCTEVCNIAVETGAFIRRESANINKKDVQTKSMHSYVTYVDKTAEKLIVGKLEELLPEAGFIVEENTIQKKGDRYNWVVDPLDGTTNFIHGIPVFSVSIALMDGHEVVLGVVYAVSTNECFHAVKGHGAFLNNEPIMVSDTARLNQSLLATGFPYYDYDRLSEFMDLFNWCMRETRGLRRLGSAAIDLAYVACGRFEGFYEYGLNAWDVAAGTLIVKEAGGKVTDFTNGKNYIFGRELVATNKKIHDQFLVQVEASFNPKT